MATITWYGDGTATVAAGSRTVTGTNTGWLTEVAGLTPIKAGDKFGIHVGRPIVIEKIISNTELLLADDWPGPAQTDAPYKVELTSPTIAAVEAMRRLLASLSNGNLESLSEISVGTDDIPIGIGPGVFSTINKAALVQGVKYDAFVATLADRAAYNGAAAGFAVLVIDVGDGRSALYFKNSATSGDWSAASYLTGPAGPTGVTWRGNYSAGTAYAVRDLVQYGGSTWFAKIGTTGIAPPTLPTTESTQWILFARSGSAGVVDRGVYSGATTYATNDIVLNNGSTWIALQPTTGNAPPVLPTESNASWRLLARKGTDGTGTGDFVGPAGGVASGDIVAFADVTGKLGRKATQDELKAAIGGLPIRGYISPDFWFSRNSGDPGGALDYPAGTVASVAAAPVLMTVPSSTTRLASVFDFSQGGRFDAAVSDGWWHVFVIGDGASSYVGLSKSLDPTGQPNYPAGYPHYRRVCSWERRSGAFVAATQIGDYFIRAGAVTERNSAGAFANGLLSVSMPVGLRLRPILKTEQQAVGNGNVQTFIGSGGGPLVSRAITILSDEVVGSIVTDVFTNLNAQVQFNVIIYSGGLSFNVLNNLGWIDPRGRV